MLKGEIDKLKVLEKLTSVQKNLIYFLNAQRFLKDLIRHIFYPNILIYTAVDNMDFKLSESSSVISNREKTFLLVTNFLIVIMIFVDMLYFGGVISIQVEHLVVSNLIVLLLSFILYENKKRIKKRIKRRLAE